MPKIYLKVVVFTLVLVGIFVYIGEAITRISGIKGGTVTVKGVNPEAGEAIFWGKGKCHTCHSIGGRGSAIRCPNLGDSNLGPIIGARAAQRAQERAAQGAPVKSATDYLVETLATPSAYIVKGFKNEMPLVYQPPISLSPDEIKAVISYLQSQGGEVDIAAIKLPATIKAASAAEVAPWEPYMAGDLSEGERLFFDLESNAGCAKCHTVKEKGGKVGPELTNVAGTRTPKFIVQSILNPSAEIASGFEPMLVITKDGRYISGVLQKEDQASIVLADSNAKVITIPKEEVANKAPQKTSIMPGNFAEILTTKELHDILAYVTTLK